MVTGTFASMIMDQNWDDASIHVTTTRRAKINAWTSSKLDNLTVLVR